MQVIFRTECNQRSKYFADIAEAYMHFHKCIAMRRSVELWVVEVKATQRLIDCVYFS